MAEEFVLDLDLKTQTAEQKMKRLDKEFNEAKEKYIELKKEEQEGVAVLKDLQDEQKKLNDLVKQQQEITSKGHDYYVSGGIVKDRNAEEFAKLDSLENKQKEINAAVAEQEEHNKKITTELGKQEQKVIKTSQAASKATKQFQKTAEAQSTMPPALDKAGKSLEKFSNRIKGLVKRVFIFSVITMALRKLRKAISDMIGQDSELQQYVKQIKGNFAVMGRTLFESMRPVIEWLLQKIAYLTQLLAVILAKVLKKDVKQMADMAKSSAKTAKNAERTTAAFDTLQKIDTTQNDNDSDAGASFEQFDVASWTDEQLAKIMAIAGTALIAIGLILCFFGQIPLGVAAIAAGIALVYTAAKMSNELEGETKAFITKLMAIVGTALIVIGVILCLTQHYLLGIAAIVIGVGMIATAVALNWGTIKEKMSQFFEEHKELIGHFLIVLGVILCMTGIGALLGVSMIKQGAEDLVQADPEKYGWLEDTIIPVLDRIKTALTGAFLIVLGVVLMVTGVGIPLGLSLLKKGMGEVYSGVSGEDSSAFFTWLDEQLDKIKQKIFDLFSKLPDGAKIFLNGLIDKLNWFIEKTNGLIRWLNSFSFGEYSLNLPEINTIPHLAKGAVIAGGSPFLAMLGDQPKGQTNIETPLETMIEAFKAAQQETNVNIEFTGTLSQLARVLNPQIKKEQKRASIW